MNHHAVLQVTFIFGITLTGIAAVGLTCQAADPQQATQSALTEEQRAERQLIWNERTTARRAADVKIFVEEFEAGQKLTVRERLDRAATVTVELAAKAQSLAGNPHARAYPQQGFGTRAAIYPRASHIARLMGVRPWLREYPHSQRYVSALRWDTAKYEWPTMGDREELRRLLEDDDPDIGIMAAEALATLYQPEDLYDLRCPDNWGQLSTPTIPVLSIHNGYSGGQQGGGLSTDFEAGSIMAEDDPLMYPSYWKQVTIGDYYDRALQQLTGAKLTAETLHQWTIEHGDDREAVWYWEYRFYREYHRFTRLVELAPPYYRLSDEDLTAFRRPLQEEIATLGRLTEARILLTIRQYHVELRRNGEIERNHSVDSRIYGTWKTRLTRDEMFRLLQGKRLWPPPRPGEKAEYYEPSDSQLVVRLLEQPELHFTVEDVPVLQRVLTQTALKLPPNAIAAWYVGISKLLPPAAPDMVDAPGTRDGYLRQQIREADDSDSASPLVRELTRIGLPANAKWLEELFFTKDKDGSPISRFAPTILTALQSRSPTRDQRHLLWSLITDDRFRPIWIHGREHFKNGLKREKSLHAHRHPACAAAYRAVCAQAGIEFISWTEYHELMSPENSDAQLEALLQKLKAYPLAK